MNDTISVDTAMMRKLAEVIDHELSDCRKTYDLVHAHGDLGHAAVTNAAREFSGSWAVTLPLYVDGVERIVTALHSGATSFDAVETHQERRFRERASAK